MFCGSEKFWKGVLVTLVSVTAGDVITEVQRKSTMCLKIRDVSLVRSTGQEHGICAVRVLCLSFVSGLILLLGKGKIQSAEENTSTEEWEVEGGWEKLGTEQHQCLCSSVYTGCPTSRSTEIVLTSQGKIWFICKQPQTQSDSEDPQKLFKTFSAKFKAYFPPSRE